MSSRFIPGMALLCSIALGASGGCGPAAKKDQGPPVVKNNPKALDQLKGTWQVISIAAGGQSVAQDRVKQLNLQYVFDGEGNVTVRRPDRPDKKNAITLDTAADPKRMTIHSDPPVRALYALGGQDDNVLQLCIMVDPNPPEHGFPTEISSRASPRTDLLHLERR